MEVPSFTSSFMALSFSVFSYGSILGQSSLVDSSKLRDGNYEWTSSREKLRPTDKMSPLKRMTLHSPVMHCDFSILASRLMAIRLLMTYPTGCLGTLFLLCLGPTVLAKLRRSI